jgi:uncharacterized membrane protein YgdD (TMEM256/DUF423 family)
VSPKTWIVIAGLTGAMGVSLGAYHAHGLDAFLKKQTEETSELKSRMENCGTAVRYQMFHGLALLGVGLMGLHTRSRSIQVAGVLFLLGMIGFSGGLYLHVFTGNFIHWSIVPAGGVLLIAGWIAIAVSGLALPKSRQDDAS